MATLNADFKQCFTPPNSSKHYSKIIHYFIYNKLFSISFENNACSHLVDQDLEGALKAIEGQDPVDPREVAIIKYTPSVENPHAEFADEVYFPPVGETPQQTIREKILAPNAIDSRY